MSALAAGHLVRSHIRLNRKTENKEKGSKVLHQTPFQRGTALCAECCCRRITAMRAQARCSDPRARSCSTRATRTTAARCREQTLPSVACKGAGECVPSQTLRWKCTCVVGVGRGAVCCRAALARVHPSAPLKRSFVADSLVRWQCAFTPVAMASAQPARSRSPSGRPRKPVSRPPRDRRDNSNSDLVLRCVDRRLVPRLTLSEQPRQLQRAQSG